MPLGPIFVSVEGKTLTPGDQKILSHDLVGGVVLFSRNYENKDQLRLLIKSIKSLKSPDLLVAVDVKMACKRLALQQRFWALNS